MSLLISLTLVAIAGTCLAGGACPPDQAWPFWQKTTSRLGRTTTRGPRVPVLAWRTRIDPSDIYDQMRSSAVLDGEGRLFVGHFAGLARIEPAAGNVVWQFPTKGNVSTTPAAWGGRVLFGAADDNFYCVDAEKGTLCWSIPVIPHPHSSPVVDNGGVVYFGTYAGVIYARRVEDGSEVWTTTIGTNVYSSPALDGNGRLFVGQWNQWVALDTATGDVLWRFQMGRDAFGTSPVENGRVYVGCRDYYLYCIDAGTGKEVWRFDGECHNGNCVALGHDGTIYHATSNTGWLFAVTPEGEEKWHYALDTNADQAPIVAGDGTVYLAGRKSPATGKVYAIRPDGTTLWIYWMPDYVDASPMLGPDGTLYVVCKDKYLYAFRDWQEAVPHDFRTAPGDNLHRFPGGGGGLGGSDDEYLVVQPGLPLLSSRPTILETWATLNSSSLGGLDVTVEGHTSAPCYQQLELFNVWANRWDVIDFGPSSLIDGTITANDIPNPSAYVNPKGNRIGLRITNWPTGFVLRPLAFTSYLDHIEFSARFE